MPAAPISGRDEFSKGGVPLCAEAEQPIAVSQLKAKATRLVNRRSTANFRTKGCDILILAGAQPDTDPRPPPRSGEAAAAEAGSKVQKIILGARPCCDNMRAQDVPAGTAVDFERCEKTSPGSFASP